MKIDLFEKSVKTLMSRGYHVFRMGDHTKSELDIFNKNYFDYSKSKIKSDFMDVFLGYICSLCISTNTGFDAYHGYLENQFYLLVLCLLVYLTQIQKNNGYNKNPLFKKR